MFVVVWKIFFILFIFFFNSDFVFSFVFGYLFLDDGEEIDMILSVG